MMQQIHKDVPFVIKKSVFFLEKTYSLHSMNILAKKLSEINKSLSKMFDFYEEQSSTKRKVQFDTLKN